MKKLLLSTTALLAMTAMAAAADLPARTVAPAPFVAAPVFTWTGFYAGVHGGYISSEADARLVGEGGVFVGAGAAGTIPTGVGLDSDGFMFGGQVGGNVQFGMFVAGIEADISYTDIGRSRTFLNVPGTVTTTLSSDMEFFGTVRGRLGLAFDRVMVYATGGLAYASLDYSGSVLPVPAGAFTSSGNNGDDMEIGWTIGGGVEFAITNNLTIKGEYLYYEFDDVTVRVAGTGGALGAADFADYRFRNEGHIGRVGINFKF